MDLVTCAGCKHVFSPTPGQRIRCPACMRFLDPPAAKAARPASTPPPAARRRLKEAAPTRSSRLNWILPVLGIAIFMAGGLWFMTRPKPADPPAEFAELPKRPKLVLPDVVDPEVPRRPERKSDVPPPLLPIGPDEPTKPKTVPKSRPIDITTLPEVETPEFKTQRFEIKKIAGVDPEKVNAAIQRGVAYLQRSSPEWSASPEWPLGVQALCGLALLECDVPPTSPLLQQVANQVRAQCANETHTYEMSLALLFLDRLRQPRDRGLIQILATRLIAGQNQSGGWSYECRPLLTQQETVMMLSILQQNRLVAARPLAPLTIGADQPPDKGNRGRDPFADPFAEPFTDPVSAEVDPRRVDKGDAGVTAKMPAEDRPQPPRILPRSRLSGQPLPMVAAPTPLPVGVFTQRLQDVPTVKQRDRSRSSLEIDFNNTVNDLSNTQFAILALWAARRHGVVSDRTLLLTEIRLRKTQLTSGSWRYQERGSGQEDAAMTCCGLLGLGLGTAADQPHGASLAQALKTDPAIQHAFDHLGSKTGDPLPDYDAVGKMESTYTLWSTERVAMMYHQKTIRGKDWYGWGAQNLIKNQDAAGSWLDPNGRSHSAPVDTALALLFLVRSNLVQEISEQIRLQMPIQEK